ncbi:MAG TPA: TonB-dependent receptor [Bryobacteraceae bacterium]|nr:TonB-dependent receptor [Bryobacteraceae bacterium]
MIQREWLDRISYRILAGALLLFVTTFVTVPVRAQVLYGQLVGTVTDQSNSVVPNAVISIQETLTGQSHQETTDSGGRYSVVNLSPGTYSVRATAKGFKTIEQSAFTITPNTVNRLDFHLEIGEASQTVTVSAEALELQTDKADTHTELTSEGIVNMPLGGFRNYQALIDLVPGATPSTFQNSVTDTPGRALHTNINGANAQTNITQIDGAESINVWLPHHVGYVVPAEDVDVVNITTSAADADQGLAGASAITLVTKSGTNEIHGSAFEFDNNQHFNARNFFADSKPVAIYNNYGATIGGPIMKNKLFYFISFDGTNQKIAANGLFTVPTDDQKNGNFSAYLTGANATTIYNPFTGNADGTGRQPFANNIIPGNLIVQQAKNLQGYFPEPNLGGIANNYYAAGGPILNRYQTDAKLNWNRTERHSIFVKYGEMVATSGGQGIFGVAGGPAPGADPGLGNTTTYVATIGHTYTFTPNLVLTGNLGLNRLDQTVLANDYGKNYGTILGIPGLNGNDIRDSGFPDISMGAYTGFGVPNWMPLFRHDETFTHSDSLTWTKGAHEFRFGFDLVRHHLNHWQPELSNGGPRGLLDFNGQTTTLNTGGGNATVSNQLNAYAQMLLGLSDDVQKGVQYILMTGREWQLGWYGQDRWQVTKNLTVSLGLRYEFYPLMTRSNGKGIEQYIPATNDVMMGGRGSVPVDAGIKVSHTLFAPRVGVAYRLGEKTVIRAGYGMNYDPLPFSRPLRGFYPLTINAETKSPNSFSYASTLAQGIPPVPLPDISTGIVPLPGNASERSPWGYIHRGYTQSWNFTVEHKLPENIIASIGYVASHTVHELADRDINTGYPGSTLANLPYNLLYGRTSGSDMWDGYLSSEYNSMQIAFSRSFVSGLMLKGAYTWSHAIDYADDDGWQGVNWNYAPMFQRNRATAGFDQPQNFQIGWVYELPFGKNKKYMSSGVAAKVLGDWQLSGREACYMGIPFTVYAPDTSLNDGGTNTQTANQVLPTVQLLGHVGPGTTYYNPAAFAPVTTVGFGNSGLNILREPGMWNTDMSVMRLFPIKERMTLQFRAEFTNLPNTSHFGSTFSGGGTGNGFGGAAGGVDNGVTDSTFMNISSSSGERNIRFGLRLQW